MSNERKAIGLKDLKVGESITGYVADFFKNPKGLTPNVENIVLLTEKGEEVTVWASGTLNYFREKMDNAGVPMGVLARITRIEKPKDAKSTRQKYYAAIAFNASKVKTDIQLSGGSRAPKDVGGGFTEY